MRKNKLLLQVFCTNLRVKSFEEAYPIEGNIYGDCFLYLSSCTHRQPEMFMQLKLIGPSGCLGHLTLGSSTAVVNIR